MFDVTRGYTFNVNSWGLNHMDYHTDETLTFVCPLQTVGLGTTVIWWNSKVSSMLCWTVTWCLEHFKKKKGIPCCVITFYIPFISCVLFTLLVDLFFFTNLFEQILKVKFLNHQFLQEQFIFCCCQYTLCYSQTRKTFQFSFL